MPACFSKREPSTSRWRSVGWGIQTGGESSHASTWRHAPATLTGRVNMRRFETKRTKANKLGQGIPTDAEPLSFPSSHACAALCCVKPEMWA